jgi:hypothetical protein
MRVLESILIGLTLLRTVRALSQSVNKDSGNAFLPSCRAYLDLAAGRARCGQRPPQAVSMLDLWCTP